MRVGQGFDAHRLVRGRPLRLGGVEVPHDRGLEGHSDGDALLHAVASALLGAAGEGDLGTHFPSSDASLEGIDSARILEQVAARVRARGFEIANVDATIVAQAPRLAAFLPRMVDAIAGVLALRRECVNVKVSSTDLLGALGREEGIAALAVALLQERGTT
ncbi:MAG: 2-C-methyl-D-erythritol 2,4-cyclodiphosphate synthase [Deltaproteobacteria bacterium]|nr:2-C-methyl-D-erythritol 2,4-cyclodiphosphate synthase [Deltaproteobacteria bacterium]MBW2362688.1 2-C-methyl-D-erythritol 2,4-cyclodiphosphate synthase [Deltaproteobacteria bacterium]